jgi:peptidoglycan/xylan/chitin deacetylase (PgdA/CDA1 family)
MRSVWLMYHDVRHPSDSRQVPASAAVYNVSPDVFEEHLSAVHASGLSVVTASASERAANDSVVLTFDDGWLGSFETAVPALVEQGLTATFYVTKDFVGRPGFCSPSAIADAAGAGMEIGVHGTTHRLLSGCTREEIVHELRACKEFLESLVQREVLAASVPGGDWSRTVAACAAEVGLTTLATSRPGINTDRTPALEARRVAVRTGTTSIDVARYCRFDTRREWARWAALQAPRRILGMQRYSRLRRRLLGERPSDGALFDP